MTGKLNCRLTAISPDPQMWVSTIAQIFPMNLTILLDCGWAANGRCKAIYENALKNLRIDLILLTHSDIEHCGGLSYVLRHQNFRDIPVVATEIVKKFGEFTVQGFFDEFCNEKYQPDIFEAVSSCFASITPMKFFEEIEVCRGSVRIACFPSGRRIGSSGFQLTINARNIIYLSEPSFIKSSSQTGLTLTENLKNPGILISTVPRPLELTGDEVYRIVQICRSTIQNQGSCFIAIHDVVEIFDLLTALNLDETISTVAKQKRKNSEQSTGTCNYSKLNVKPSKDEGTVNTLKDSFTVAVISPLGEMIVSQLLQRLEWMSRDVFRAYTRDPNQESFFLSRIKFYSSVGEYFEEFPLGPASKQACFYDLLKNPCGKGDPSERLRCFRSYSIILATPGIWNSTDVYDLLFPCMIEDPFNSIIFTSKFSKGSLPDRLRRHPPHVDIATRNEGSRQTLNAFYRGRRAQISNKRKASALREVSERFRHRPAYGARIPESLLQAWKSEDPDGVRLSTSHNLTASQDDLMEEEVRKKPTLTQQYLTHRFQCRATFYYMADSQEMQVEAIQQETHELAAHILPEYFFMIANPKEFVLEGSHFLSKTKGTCEFVHGQPCEIEYTAGFTRVASECLPFDQQALPANQEFNVVSQHEKSKLGLLGHVNLTNFYMDLNCPVEARTAIELAYKSDGSLSLSSDLSISFFKYRRQLYKNLSAITP